MADKEIKVHRRVIRMIFPMNNDRSVCRALPVYDNGVDREQRFPTIVVNGFLHLFAFFL